MNGLMGFEGTLLDSSKTNEVFCLRVLQLDDGTTLAVSDPLEADGTMSAIMQGTRVKAKYRELHMPGCAPLAYFEVRAAA